MADGILTAQGQLAIASEFRFDVWHTEDEHRYITVKRGRRRFEHKWAIVAGEADHGHFWTGAAWDFTSRGADTYKWELEEALTRARELAFEMNQGMVAMMERRFPSQFRGGPHDMATERHDGKAISAD